MVVLPVGATSTYALGLSGRLDAGDSIAGIVSVTVSPSTSLVVGSYEVSNSAKGVILNNVSGGEQGDYYTVSVVVTTFQGKAVATDLTIAVASIEAMARAVTVLEMIRRIRTRIRDDNKRAVITIPEGYEYKWEYDDSALLVSNESLIEFLNDARDEYAKRTPIADSQSAITKIQIKDGTNRYPYDPRILAIRAVWIRSTSVPLFKASQQQMDRILPDWRDSPIPIANDSVCDPIGPEGRYIEDGEQKILTLGFVPTQDDVLDMHVERLPFEKCAWANRWDIILEPDQQYLEALISWVEYKVYNVQDTELFDETRGTAAMQAFDDAIGPRFSARQLTARRAMANMVLDMNARKRRCTYRYQ